MADITILLTRPAAAAARFAQGLGWAEGRAQVLISPVLEIVETGEIPVVRDYVGVIFTSSHAVRPAPVPLPAYCVGPRTAETARQAGWAAQDMGGNADALVAALAASKPDGRLLHLHGRLTRGDVAARLMAAGVPTEGHEIYDQRLLPLSDAAKTAVAGKSPCIIPLFSPRSARQFAREAQGGQGLHLVLISAALQAELTGLRVQSCTIAQHPRAGSVNASLHATLQRVEATQPAR